MADYDPVDLLLGGVTCCKHAPMSEVTQKTKKLTHLQMDPWHPLHSRLTLFGHATCRPG